MVRVWTLGGELVSDASFAPPAPDAPPPGALAFLDEAAELVGVLWGPSVAVLRARSGVRAWAWAHESAATHWDDLHVTADAQTLVVYGRAGSGRGSSFARAELELASGAVRNGGAQLVSSPAALDAGADAQLTLEPRFLVALDATGTKLVFQPDGGDGAHSGGAVRTASLAALGGSGATLERAALPGAVLLRFGPAHVAIVDLTTGEPHVRWEARTAGPAAVGSLRSGAQAVVAVLSAAAEGASGSVVPSLVQSTVLVTPGSAEELPSPPGVALSLAEHGAAEALFLGGYSKREGAVQQSALLVTRDGGVHGLAEGRALWSLEEALARPAQLEFVHLPRVRDMDALAAGPQYGQLLRLLARTLGLGAGAKAPATAVSKLTADAFGFKKLLVVRTASSKLLALHANDGQHAWSALPTLEGAPVEVLTMCVVPAASGLETDLQLVVRTPGNADAATHAVLTYDGLSGALRASVRLPARVVWSVGVPAGPEEGAPTVGHAFVLADLSLHLLPATAEVAAAFAAFRANAYFFLVDKADGSIRGYGLVKAGDNAIRAQHRWTYVPPANAQGMTVAQLDPAEKVHSPVTVLGDRSVLHKYLNRNLLAVGYTQLDRAGAPEPSAHVTLLDGVSGAAVYDYVQPRTSGPIRLALTENMLAASAHSASTGAPIVSLIELYENATKPDYVRMLLTGTEENAGRVRSAFELRAPFALSTAFQLPAELSTMAFTQTAKGITPRHLMVALRSGQLLALDKRMIDPRRPTGAPSTADREEGLAQYSPLLPLMPQALLTHGQRVGRAAGVRCVATTLESTSIVAMYGTDLFVARYSPAKNFDLLHDSFNHVALALAVFGLAVGTVVTTWLRRRSELNALWR
ncbi:hypothetical protein T492DRAFT_936244 [Pavlovales sp. CCMP2436]|nr:hypothetical protein T492DRAFT_936244 [Pavlovales sp. CCMP2436]